MRRTSLLRGLTALLWAMTGAAQAQDATGQVAVSTSAPPAVSGKHATEPPDLEAESHAEDRPIRRYRPTLLSFEAGLYGGAFFFNDDHNLQSLTVVQERGHETLRIGGEVGLRLAFFPVWFFGVEGEGGIIFSEAEQSEDKAMVLTGRGHAVLQLPLGRLVPFLVGGGGVLSLSTDDSIGDDVDPVVYFGGGLKYNFNQRIAIRVDARDNLMQKNRLIAGTKDGDFVHSPEVLLGFSVTVGRTPWAPRPPDTDKDGLYDRDDQCPADSGPAPTGCPPPPDTDTDGIPDASDPCPAEAEDNQPPEPKDGCPNKDLDNDTILLPVDLCPNEAGIAPDGCPPKDSDGDGLMDPDDRCPKDAETVNNFQDQDGCPDEVPQEVQKFTGVIKGILFDTGKTTIRSSSFPLLDDAVAVLNQYPELRIRISGHTDNRGRAAKNQLLSESRANAVKTYLTEKGIADNRIETRGAGQDEPIADNKSSSGRSQNRRIEFELLPQ